MTSSPVMGTGYLPNVNMQATSPNTNKTDFADFKNFMSQSRSKLDSISNNVSAGKMQTNKFENKAKEVNTDEKEIAETVEATEVADNTVTEVKEVPDEQVTDVKDAIKKVVELIKEEFDVTDEEIEIALETLGLTQIALLDTEVLPQVVAEVTGAEDTLSIVTDENAYQGLIEVSAKVNELMGQLSEATEIPETELLEAVKTYEEVSNETTVETSIGKEKMPETELTDEPVKETKTFESKITYVNKENRTETQVSLDNEVETNVTTETKIDTDLRKSDNFEQHGSENNAPMTFAENLMSKVAEALNEEAGQVTYSSIDAQNIMDQITESIKVNASAENTEINMRLHPESLGSVSVKVSANNEGVLTAQFIAQNESVKAIIESQAVVLRENLESKGVTVEAVEVLVQSHEFERNLSDQNRGQSEQDNRFAKRTRRINLLDEADDSLTEGEELVKEMMIQNGNTVDYSA